MWHGRVGRLVLVGPFGGVAGWPRAGQQWASIDPTLQAAGRFRRYIPQRRRYRPPPCFLIWVLNRSECSMQAAGSLGKTGLPHAPRLRAGAPWIVSSGKRSLDVAEAEMPRSRDR